ncbi:MAG TPA: glycosyltransferase, partial [Pseudomonadales bacterium]|nr:glycosyltransferase [Pseudomonadales bacterium]
LLPSLYEGFGLTALEAMQYGVPVIGSDRSAIPEVVGQGGILVDPLSVDSLSKAMRDVSTDRELQATLSRHALEQASNFSWQKAAKETMAVFIRVVA